MKRKIAIAALFLSVFACTPTGDSLIWILERGTEQAKKAQSLEELSKITYDVKDKMMTVGKLPGGDKKLSPQNTERVLEAQKKFYQAVDKRAEELKQSKHY